MCLLTFQVFGNHLLSVSSKQVTRFEKGAEVTAGEEHVPGWRVERSCPPANAFSARDKRVFKASIPQDTGMVQMWGHFWLTWLLRLQMPAAANI